jgi:hypothetical protein
MGERIEKLFDKSKNIIEEENEEEDLNLMENKIMDFREKIEKIGLAGIFRELKNDIKMILTHKQFVCKIAVTNEVTIESILLELFQVQTIEEIPENAMNQEMQQAVIEAMVERCMSQLQDINVTEKLKDSLECKYYPKSVKCGKNGPYWFHNDDGVLEFSSRNSIMEKYQISLLFPAEKEHPLNPRPEEYSHLEIVLAESDASISNTLLFMEMLQSEYPFAIMLLRDITNQSEEELNSPIIFILNPYDRIVSLDFEDTDVDNIFYQQSFEYLTMNIQDKYLNWRPHSPKMYLERMKNIGMIDNEHSIRQRFFTKIKVNKLNPLIESGLDCSLIRWIILLDFYLMGNNKDAIKYFRMKEIKDDDPVLNFYKTRHVVDSNNNNSSKKLKSLWSFL